jgi:hypothetical protein
MLPLAGLVPQFAKGAASLGADESIALDEPLDSEASSDDVSATGVYAGEAGEPPLHAPTAAAPARTSDARDT